MLAGDGHWQALRDIEDVNKIIGKLEKECFLRIYSKAGETVDRMWDSRRGRLLFALPPKVVKVAISAGSVELRDPTLLTLTGASLEEVRRANEEPLRAKARTLLAMLSYLAKQGKQVMLLLPPCGEEGLEISQHWEDIVLEEMGDLIVSGSLKIINLPAAM